MTWTPEIVRARFVEAADTERYLPRPQIGSGKGYWPATLYTAEDREGWDDVAKIDNADRWARNRKLTREAIARHEECLIWSMTLLTDERYRRIVWTWAFCQARGGNFTAACRREGWVRMTAYRRLDASCVTICERLVTTDALVRLPEEKYLLPIGPAQAINQVSSEPRAPLPVAHPPFRPEKPRDTLKTEADLLAFCDHLAETNAARRKLQARRSRREAA